MQKKTKSITLLTHIILSCLMRARANLQHCTLGRELLEQVNTAKYCTATLSFGHIVTMIFLSFSNEFVIKLRTAISIKSLRHKQLAWCLLFLLSRSYVDSAGGVCWIADTTRYCD